MTGTCPICNNHIEAAFGMVQCSKCQSMLFIDFSGNIVVGGNETDHDSVSKVESHTHENISHFESTDNRNNDFDSDSGLDPDTDIQDIELTTNEYSQVIDRDPKEGAVESSMAHSVLDTNSVDNFNPDYTQNLSNNQSTNVHSSPNQGSEFSQSGSEHSPLTADIQEDFSILSQSHEPNEQELMNEINSSNESSGPPTVMSYKLQIRGIDTATLRKTVLEALFDKRLGLVSNEISESINNGCLTVTGLNPVKASFILNALKQYPLEIDWELNVH